MNTPNCKKCYHYCVCHYVDSTLPVCGVYIEREKVVAAIQAEEERNKGCNYCNLVLKKDSCVFCRNFHRYPRDCQDCRDCHDATPPMAMEMNRVKWKSKDNYCRDCGRKLT